MSLDLKYFRNLWVGEWLVTNTATGTNISIGRGKIHKDTFHLANTGTTGTTFSFQGTDPRQKQWDDQHLMFSLVINKDVKQMVIKWEEGSGIPQSVLPFSGDVGKVLLTLDSQMSGVLGVIVDDGKIGETEMVWESYYDKCPAPRKITGAARTVGK